MTTHHVATEFTDDLGGRYYTDGDFSGQEFREKLLYAWVEEALRSGQELRINFDGVTGMPTSFLEEAFGGLIRKRAEWSYADLARLMKIEAPQTPRLWNYIRYAENAMRKAAAKRDKR